MTARLLAAISHVATPHARNREQERIATLTIRERHIVSSLMRQPQRSLREVATSLAISERTLRNHLSSIYDKLAVGSRVELWAFANKHGLARKSA